MQYIVCIRFNSFFFFFLFAFITLMENTKANTQHFSNSPSVFLYTVFCCHSNRFDARGKPLSMGRRWSEVVSFGLRADFRFSLHGQIPSKGHLIINGTTLADEGIYRCRVDFKNSPARHFRVQLNVTGECPSHLCTFDFRANWLEKFTSLCL